MPCRYCTMVHNSVAYTTLDDWIDDRRQSPQAVFVCIRHAPPPSNVFHSIAFYLNDEPALFALLACNPHMLRSLRCIFLARMRSESFNKVYWQASIECIGRHAASYRNRPQPRFGEACQAPPPPNPRMSVQTTRGKVRSSFHSIAGHRAISVERFSDACNSSCVKPHNGCHLCKCSTVRISLGGCATGTPFCRRAAGLDHYRDR